MRMPGSRSLAVALGTSLAVVLVLQFRVLPLAARSRGLKRDMPRARNDLAYVRDLDRERLRLRGSAGGSAARTASRSEIFSAIDLEIRRSKVDAVYSLKDDPGDPGSSKRLRFSVSVKAIGMPELIGLLYGIESSPYGFQLNNLRLEAIGDGRQLKAGFEVSALVGE